MLKLKEAVIVEGKYDAIKLSGVVDTLILTTEGFGIFKDKEKQALLRRLAKTRGIIVLTDSDSAGFLIRSFLRSAVPEGSVKHVYIPDVFGKEKRKTAPGAEGKLGVEGIAQDVLLEAFHKSGITAEESETPGEPITHLDLYEAGLSGCENSREKRKLLLQKLALPERLSTGNLVKLLNCFVNRDEFLELVKEL